jgi:hypothetical protein
MDTRIALALRALSAALVFLPLVASADSMRCGNKLVKEDDTLDEVLALCGEPVSKQRTWIQRAPQFEYGGDEYPFPGREDVPVDVWIYDFGSHKLRMRVRFVAGKVQAITPAD